LELIANIKMKEEITNAIKMCRTVAVVGLSGDSSRASNLVARFLKSRG
jgi:predicted CoA-binding protein